MSGDTKRMVFKLKKSIYGLKHASRQWYYKFHQVIISSGFEMNMVDVSSVGVSIFTWFYMLMTYCFPPTI